jgi:hypothetical protein
MQNKKALRAIKLAQTRHCLGPSTNSIILSAIPIQRKLKRYWRSKYERIAQNCGTDEAVAKFKNLRVQVLRYLSDPGRKSNLGKYLSSTGFRINGYLRQLFELADTQPHFVLSFLKMYTAQSEPSMTADQAAGAVKRRLSQVKANDAIPRYLNSWLSCLSQDPEYSYWNALTCVNDPFHKAAEQHSLQEWTAYWRKWYGVLRRGWQSDQQPDFKPVFPEIYKDYEPDNMRSSSYEADFADLISLHMTEENSPLSRAELDFVDGYLNDEVGDALYAVLWGESPMGDLFQETSLLSGTYVGHVQHIHKKGGGTELRDIAVPNRFIQNALVPAANRLYAIVRLLPCDATFDQDRFDTKIQNRVNNDNLYQGSVDLSKATDNLPFSWGDKIISELSHAFDYSRKGNNKLMLLAQTGGYAARAELEQQAEFWQSYALFRTVARANWEDEGYHIRWQVGQPLGSLPSFAMLSITHNLLLESMALMMGLMHSPYVVLGDDVVIFNKKLRSRYIRELSSRGIPLSLHKSYEGRLSEFAGKTYVKGSVPFYCSDHNPVTWNSLFDWQRTTGIRIPWDLLPRSIRKRIEMTVSKSVITADNQPSKSRLKQLARSSYDLSLTCEVCGRGSHLYQISDSAEQSERISRYFEYRWKTQEAVPEAIKHSGITVLGGRHPVTLMSYRFADKDGFFQRFRPVELPEWYKAKVRPCATDAVIRAACMAVST